LTPCAVFKVLRKTEDVLVLFNFPVAMSIISLIIILVSAGSLVLILMIYLVTQLFFVLIWLIFGIVWFGVGIMLFFVLAAPSIVVFNKETKLVTVNRFILCLPLNKKVRILDENTKATVSYSWSRRGGQRSQLVVELGDGERLAVGLIASNVHFDKYRTANLINEWLGNDHRLPDYAGGRTRSLLLVILPLLSIGGTMILTSVILLISFEMLFRLGYLPIIFFYLLVLMLLVGILLVVVGIVVGIIGGIYAVCETNQKNEEARRQAAELQAAENANASSSDPGSVPMPAAAPIFHSGQTEMHYIDPAFAKQEPAAYHESGSTNEVTPNANPYEYSASTPYGSQPYGGTSGVPVTDYNNRANAPPSYLNNTGYGPSGAL
jgi:hypothetical protein